MSVAARVRVSMGPRRQRLTTELAGLRPSLIHKAQVELARTATSPAILQAARRKAQAVVAAARSKAAAGRVSATTAPAIAQLDARMKAAKAQFARRWQAGGMRTPAQVIQSVIGRIDAAAPAVPRARQTVLLVRSKQAALADFSDLLAKELGLASTAALKASRIQVSQVAAPRDGTAAVYSVRLPIRQSSMRAEIHNLAWALRKSGKFQSVRPDGGARMIFAAAPGHADRAERVFAWHLDQTRVSQAHDLVPPGSGATLGRNIVIAHPDTGWTSHPNLNEARIDPQQSFNAGTGQSGSAAARTSSAIADADLPNLNHGTSTASIMVGAANPDQLVSALAEADLDFPRNALGNRVYGGSDRVLDRTGTLIGVAPQARIRSIKFIADVAADIDRTGLNGAGVVRFADEDLVAAIDHARTTGAHVISLSIGGLMHEAVHEALDRAVRDASIIVVAAAGQTYTGEGLSAIASAAAGIGIGDGDTVALPAAYQNVIAVAGCTPDGRPWDESLRGPNVDITAPADAIWVADFEVDEQKGTRTPVLECASGTSFATAFMAGAAALWLAHWDRAELLRRYPDTPLAWVFRRQLQRTARTVHKDGWDTGLYGPGIVDVLALLREPLPDPRDVPEPPATVENVFTVLSGALVDSPGAEFAADVWGLIWDVGTMVIGGAEAFAEAAWATGRATADRLIDLGEQALTDLHAWADATGRAADSATRDAIAGLTGMIESAAAMGEEAVEAASAQAEQAAEAASDFVEQVADTVGEAAQDAADFLFGWV